MDSGQFNSALTTSNARAKTAEGKVSSVLIAVSGQNAKGIGTANRVDAIPVLVYPSLVLAWDATKIPTALPVTVTLEDAPTPMVRWTSTADV